ncbi:MAG: hypothetical protein AAF483_30320 [Planctomycetota bacterium]
MNCRVVKVGGSLLDLPDLASRIDQWLESQPPLDNYFIVGGGEMVEAVRVLDRIHSLDEEFAHWFCVDLLNGSSKIMHQICPKMDLIKSEEFLGSIFERRGTVPDAKGTKTFLVQPSAFYRNRNSQNCGLPSSWATTTDSIAALLCNRLNAQELVLLKSQKPPETQAELENLAASGYVDASFPLAAMDLNVRFVNLRSVDLDA